MIQVAAEAPPPKFNYIVTQDSWRINFKTLTRQDFVESEQITLMIWTGSLAPLLPHTILQNMRQRRVPGTYQGNLLYSTGEEMGTGEGTQCTHMLRRARDLTRTNCPSTGLFLHNCT